MSWCLFQSKCLGVFDYDLNLSGNASAMVFLQTIVFRPRDKDGHTDWQDKKKQ